MSMIANNRLADIRIHADAGMRRPALATPPPEHARLVSERNPHGSSYAARVAADVDRGVPDVCDRKALMELLYRSGLYSLREIGRACGVADSTVACAAKRNGWRRER